ncbi:alpha/beta hydrolase family protein [Steroidobacter sp.]|uniref:alpha/beta hydrolase family protein n=1 Tax=Steroidobacter sp. TaxID=1978227 RepID=UPI001A43826E|nr:hypothetical protein [Steroidobacter sp.]MBL8265176.1 hypothetical protein [Steroidobacter sp.]
MKHRVRPMMGALYACTLSLASLHLSASAIAADGTKSVDVPVQPFSGELRGPYQTGTFEAFWVNDALDDPSTAAVGDKRKVMVQAWYPAAPAPQLPFAPYAISPQLYGKEHWVHRLEHVRTQSRLNAPVAAGQSSLPLLIYNHGNGNPHFTGTFQTEFLASHGYVVVAIGHPGANSLERFPDGTKYKNDGEQWRAPAPAGLSQREAYEYQAAHADLSLYLGDLSFVLDRLTQLNADPAHPFYRRLDLQRVGSLGWSLGGFVSLQAARDDSRIKAAANLDGWPWGLLGPKGAVTLGVERPVLLMFNGGVEPNAQGDGLADPDYIETWFTVFSDVWELLRRSTKEWYYVSIAGTNHESFSDRPLFFADKRKQWMNPQAAHEIVNAYTLEFFDKHVRGAAVEPPLLSGAKSFPEATLIRRRPPK